jgi:four helix bundle protein
MQDFRNVDVWKKAHSLALSIYQETRSMPHEEVFGMTMQLRRSAAAVPSRIAEGCGRETDAEFALDIRRAIAGCSELEYLILLANDLRLLSPETAKELSMQTVEARKMLFGLRRKM